MICYRDKTFCPFSECANFETCDRAYTQEVQGDAVKWWGSEGAPVALWASEPGCYQAPTSQDEK